MTRKEFMARLREASRKHPTWRYGQTAWNVAAGIDFDLAMLFCATRFDPFYIDARAEDFVAEFLKLYNGDRQ